VSPGGSVRSQNPDLQLEGSCRKSPLPSTELARRPSAPQSIVNGSSGKSPLVLPGSVPVSVMFGGTVSVLLSSGAEFCGTENLVLLMYESLILESFK